MRSRLALVAALLVGCAHPVRPTIAGAELYANLAVLQTEGQVILPATHVKVRTDQTLVTPDRRQMFLVRTIIDHCRGGDPEQDMGCTLAVLRDLRFEVHDTPPMAPVPGSGQDEPRHGIGFRASGVLVGVGLAAALTYGVVVCEFPGCKAVFGLPLAIDAVLTLLVLASGR